MGLSGLGLWLDDAILLRKGCSKTSRAPLLFPRRYALSLDNLFNAKPVELHQEFCIQSSLTRWLRIQSSGHFTTHSSLYKCYNFNFRWVSMSVCFRLCWHVVVNRSGKCNQVGSDNFGAKRSSTSPCISRRCAVDVIDQIRRLICTGKNKGP